jgi:adenosine deaminase
VVTTVCTTYRAAAPLADALSSLAVAAMTSPESAGSASPTARDITRAPTIAIHAGEEGSAGYVREALDVCHVERIDHGYTAASDPDLVRRLAQENIALTMCPLSNLRLQVVDDLTAYPLSLLLDAGVQVTLNSDDPPSFGGYINANYEAVGRSLELTQATLAQIARNGFLGSFASPEDIAAGVDAVNAYLEHLNSPQ